MEAQACTSDTAGALELLLYVYMVINWDSCGRKGIVSKWGMMEVGR